jgi:AcrR family transcriptional regulator
MRDVEERLMRAGAKAMDRRRLACAPGAVYAHGDAATTRRLIEAGRRVFSARGAGVTVREICAEAGANVAAVNYHFGSKAGLLGEVMRSLLDELLETFPMDGGVPGDAPAETRLHGFVLAFLCRILMPAGSGRECLLGRLLSEAFVRPVPSFEPYALRHRKEVRDYLLPLLGEIA